MGTTIRCRIFLVGQASPARFNAWLASMGMSFASLVNDASLENISLNIELAVMPEILKKLMDAGYFMGQPEEWSLLDAGTHGILIYICHQEAGDDYVFIPQHNILCIATADSGFVSHVQGHTDNLLEAMISPEESGEGHS